METTYYDENYHKMAVEVEVIQSEALVFNTFSPE
jgi:hypothetical protein